MINLLKIITDFSKPLFNFIDELHTSDEEKLKLKNELTTIQNGLNEKMIELESQVIKAKQEIIKSESQGQSWLQRNWRPLLMLIVIIIIANNYIIFPYLSFLNLKIKMLELPTELFTLLTIGVGGYVIGRSGEKISKNLKKGE